MLRMQTISWGQVRAKTMFQESCLCQCTQNTDVVQGVQHAERWQEDVLDLPKTSTDVWRGKMQQTHDMLHENARTACEG